MVDVQLGEMVRRQGPFASVYLDFSHDTEDALDLERQRWQAATTALAEQGVDEDTADALARAWSTADPAPGRVGRAMVAAHGEVLLDTTLAEPPAQPMVRVSDPPYLLPVLSRTPKTLPHVIVVADKVGVDYKVVGAGGDVTRSDSVDGDDHPIHKFRGGGWSHLRMQHRVEETVKRNMGEAAEEIAVIARKANARLVAIGGEVQARTALHAELPTSIRDHAVQVEAGSRAEGADEERLHVEVEKALAELDAADHLSVIDTFRSELDGGRALEGLSAVAAALREGNAQVVLVGPDLEGEVWFEPGAPEHIGCSAEELREVNSEDAQRGRADECVPAAALAVSAEVRTVGAELPLRDGVGVLRRYTP